ncbi:MAG TPA: hypothetical protein VI389_10610 [Geobacteraceae bacterium]
MAALHDLVLVHIDNQPGFFARVEDISPDVKPGWWQVKLLVLTLPLQVYTWILDESQIEGAPFTMGGTPVRLEKVVSPLPATEPEEPADGASEKTAGAKKGGAKVVSLLERKKEK